MEDGYVGLQWGAGAGSVMNFGPVQQVHTVCEDVENAQLAFISVA